MKNLLVAVMMLVAFGATAEGDKGNGLASSEKGNGLIGDESHGLFSQGTGGGLYLGHETHGLVGGEGSSMLVVDFQAQFGQERDGLISRDGNGVAHRGGNGLIGKETGNGVIGKEGGGRVANSAGGRGG